MTHLTITNIVLALSGMLLHILIKIQKNKATCKAKGEVFSLKLYFKDNLIGITISCLSVVALLFMFEDILSLFGIDIGNEALHAKLINLYGLFSFVIGYFNYSLIRTIVKIFDKRIKLAAKKAGGENGQ